MYGNLLCGMALSTIGSQRAGGMTSQFECG